MTVTLNQITQAYASIKSAILQTPCLPSPRLSKLLGAEIIIKYENFQVTHAFKERGALNKLLTLSPREQKCGVIAMSAGNHAQAVAYHAKRLNIPATIVMPKTTPYVKVAATAAHGANVILEGNNLTEATQKAYELARSKNLIFIHPFDDEAVIAGQGTITIEMLEQCPELQTLIIPIGGGGLLSGMAIAAKTIKPDIKIIGVQSVLYPSMWNEIKQDHLPIGGPTLAEGIAVETAGEQTKAIINQYVDDIVLVEEPILEQAVNLFLTQQSVVAEGAGAAGLAAMIQHQERFKNQKIGIVLCGGNIDARILSGILMRELERDKRIVSFRLTIPDRPGILGHIATILGELSANILEVDHKRHFLDVPAKGARLDVTVETRDSHHAEQIFKTLSEFYEVIRIDKAAG